MGKVLNIVNGDMSVEIMKKAHINGDFLPWRDFLHEGPAPKFQKFVLILFMNKDLVA
jgi:hypothetical protein